MKVRTVGGAVRTLLALALVASLLLTSSALAAGGRTYTLDADFDEGNLVNVNHDAPNNDQLQLNEDTKPFPFIAVAASGRGTIVRINTVTGEIIGEYWSAPAGRGRNPSRTTVDLYGNVWAGNRDEASGQLGSVIKIGLVVGGTRSNSDGSPNPTGDYLKPPFDYNTCVDRDGDGLIKTSRGLADIRSWSNAGGADDGGGVSTADDEAILLYVRTLGTNVRHVSVDGNHNVWVGGYGHSVFALLDDDTGASLANFAVGGSYGGYGGLVDGNGVLWSSDRSPMGLLRYDTKNTMTTADDTFAWMGLVDSYGLALDTGGNVWHARYGQNNISKYDSAGNLYAGFPKTTGGAGGDRGVAVTPADDNVWVANSWGSDVSRLDNNGNIVTTVAVGSMPTGVAVDAAGKVWVTNYNSNNAMRINPATNLVDLTVDLGAGAAPYNYSDMTGIIALQAAREGMWTVVYDSGTPGTDWGTVSWNSNEPAGTGIKVEVRASDNPGSLPGETFVEVSNGVMFGGMTGQHIEIRTTFSREDGVSETSVLYDLTVEPKDGPTPQERTIPGITDWAAILTVAAVGGLAVLVLRRRGAAV